MRPEMVSEKADSLRVDCLLEKPRNYDWFQGCPDVWEVVQPFFYEDFDEPEADNTEKTGYYSFCGMKDSNQPMMNYYYPLPGGPYDSEDAKKINHLNLCLVNFLDEETYGLALTGGGMDFSWQICEAYIRLGFYPPTHFRLPRFAGMKATERNLKIVHACIKGREIAETWMQNDIKDLDRVVEWLVENSTIASDSEIDPKGEK